VLQMDAGPALQGLGRQHGFSDTSFKKRCSRIGGMLVTNLRPLRGIEGENAKLKKLPAEEMVDVYAPKVVARGKR
jgi:putative transposase